MIDDDYEVALREREHMENLLIHRFNFFMTFFSIVIAGAVSVFNTNPEVSIIVLTIGLIILWFIRDTIVRCQIKFTIILDYILPEKHTNNQVNNIIKCIQGIKKDNDAKYKKIIKKIEKEKKLYRKIKKTKSEKGKIGFLIPNLCLIFLFFLVFINIIYCVYYRFFM
jgi:hypothetical protein